MKINIKNIKVKSICATLFISLFLACNNGIEELEKRNTFLSSLANLGNDFLDVFTSFGDSLGGVLGFNTETKKSDVGKYFKNIEDSLTTIKTRLNTIVQNMKSENNPNAVGTEAAVATLSEKLAKIIDGAKAVSEVIVNDSSLIADFNSNGAGVVAEDVGKLVEGIKNIVEVVLGPKEGNPEAGDDKQAKDGTTQRTASAAASDAGKLFSTSDISSNEKESATDAAKAVGAVTGADILKAMIKNDGDAVKLEKTGGTAAERPKDATIAGAMALRAMAKKGKFANKSNNDAYVKKIVGDAVVSAVTKALNTLTIAIRKTIDSGLKKVKEAMKINSNDIPVTTESKN
ncbi:variable large family protein (plasmid) [Borrelia coriaceae]|uniref:Variable large protein n=1 Tax=Borrelia coriaceae ATCC 43381 TaxID=1408429 RepID=W5SX48_9SPIR|nr:variable large family protein [Borrelia coriaceae]AHH11437.1 Variable outer membrane protein [Borrelia coriaceae ATCC 43381]UPA17407.1 variable large family protein [Borrelia coriaceae]